MRSGAVPPLGGALEHARRDIRELFSGPQSWVFAFIMTAILFKITLYLSILKRQ